MRYLFLFITLVSLAACSTEAVEPKFQKIENIKVVDITSNNVRIDADAVIYNPNPVTVYLNKIEVEIFANNTKVGNVLQTQQVDIPKKDNFYVPLEVSFNPKELFKDNLGGLLESAMNSYLNKKVDMLYQGYAQFEVKGITFDIPFTYEEEIKLEKE